MSADPAREGKWAYRLFLLYLVSFFLHLPARLPILGSIRFEVILVALISYQIIVSKKPDGSKLDAASKYLIAILAYSFITLPFVEWPGSVISSGFMEFIKGAIFYFFTVNLIITEKRLKVLILVFLFCNLFRVLEPLYLHITEGYLGSQTYLGVGEFAGRLSGAPSDVVNPNGLAFIIATIIPFFHYLLVSANRKKTLCYLLLAPVLVYAMVLTLSRSGALAIGIIASGIWLKSKHKITLALIGIVGLGVIYANLSDVQRDRYLSIVSSDARQSASAEGRLEGWTTDFRVAMNRPLLGHGLGTSREANWNVAGKDQISHILWAEVWQEIGLIGLIIFVLYVKTIIQNFITAGRLVKEKLTSDDFLYRTVQAMQVWLLMNLLFSFASFGLKSYEWYFFGGLSVALYRLTVQRVEGERSIEISASKAVGFQRRPRIRRIRKRV
ncbi:MAG: O-antigen ligase family protein [Marinobacter sp.]|uniref:O-antigen ligase family protein n=1 Tax=Marinobacter sp. TaxID=50741 RepID=UPI00299F04FE|nr:O-antigen ligase family protein [Marinobacter sp.]MDX1754888.1 O-antigen ligase family protein [Marinobacter sp.]